MCANYYANGNNLQLLHMFNLAHVTYFITRSHTCQLITHHQHPTTTWDPNDVQHHLGIGIFYELTFFYILGTILVVVTKLAPGPPPPLPSINHPSRTMPLPFIAHLYHVSTQTTPQMCSLGLKVYFIIYYFYFLSIF